MYWYYKYPLIFLLLVVVTGIGVLAWRKLPDGTAGKVVDTIKTPFSGGDSPAENQTPSSPSESDKEGGNSPGELTVEPPSGSVADESHIAERLAVADRQLVADNPAAARELALMVISDPGVRQFDRNWYHAAEIISAADTIFMNSDAPSPDRQAYTVQSGDTLSGIAKRSRTTVGALQRINRLGTTTATIFPGQVLYALTGVWSISVSKSQYVLLLLKDGKLFKMYRVGIGRQNKTPVGTFEVESKVIHPDWTPPGKRIPYGDPANVLGTHWLGLVPVGDTNATLSGYGIHGTWKPETVGKAASAGCIRMANEDVAELFDFVPEPGSQTRVSVLIEE